MNRRLFCVTSFVSVLTGSLVSSAPKHKNMVWNPYSKKYVEVFRKHIDSDHTQVIMVTDDDQRVYVPLMDKESRLFETMVEQTLDKAFKEYDVDHIYVCTISNKNLANVIVSEKELRQLNLKKLEKKNG